MMDDSTIFNALSDIQVKLAAPKGQTNSFGNYKYRSCEDILTAVKPFLEEHGAVILLSDKIIEVGGRIYVEATAEFLMDGKGMRSTASARESAEKKGMDAAQITGAASSYARKYALNGLLAIDDTKDADHSNNKEEPQSDLKKRFNDAKKKALTHMTEGAFDLGVADVKKLFKDYGDQIIEIEKFASDEYKKRNGDLYAELGEYGSAWKTKATDAWEKYKGKDLFTRLTTLLTDATTEFETANNE